jgi:error-prone DNA polymerase
MVMWDKDSCSDAGFLKIDLLGLGMLSAVERCVELIHRRRNERIDLSRIPYDDKPTYEAIQNAETTGVFQIESRAQMGSLLRTRPKTLEDLTIQVAIVRPGPIQGGAVNPYIARLQALRANPGYEVPYEHPCLREVLAETLGTIIFQDQVIEVAMAFAGFSPGQAEGLRRAMSRKRSAEALGAFHDDFVAGAHVTHGAGAQVAERVWSMIVGFSGFGFPKAHGAAFGLLAYQSTWLRVHYGPEFLCSLLDEQPMGFYPPDALVHDAQRRGIDVLAPDVNHSAVGCTVTPAGAVRIGLGYVLGVRADEVAALVEERAAGGPFGSLGDLASRAGAGRPALETLAWSGACDALADGDRRRALWTLGIATPAHRVGSLGASPVGTGFTSAAAARRAADAAKARGEGTQLSLPLELPVAPELERLSGWQSMIADYATTGLTTGPHALGLLRDRLRAEGMVTSAGLGELPHRVRVTVAGIVVARQRPGTAKGVVFMLLEDEAGTINLVVPPAVYERDRAIVRSEPLVVAEGRLERHPMGGGQINVVVARLRALDGAERPAAQVKDFSLLDEAQLAAAEGGDFRAVSPPVQSFASGRRR